MNAIMKLIDFRDDCIEKLTQIFEKRRAYCKTEATKKYIHKYITHVYLYTLRFKKVIFQHLLLCLM
jgi:hypothetical protein